MTPTNIFKIKKRISIVFIDFRNSANNARLVSKRKGNGQNAFENIEK
jgi:hypothetical protein